MEGFDKIGTDRLGLRLPTRTCRTVCCSEAATPTCPTVFSYLGTVVDTVTDRLGVRLHSNATYCYRRLPSPADPRAKDAFLITAYRRTAKGLALYRNSKVITFLQWRGIRVKHTGKQQKHGPSLTATRTAKKWSLEQAQVLSALEHSQAFLISLGAQRQAGWRRDKHWVGRAWQVLHVLDVPYPPSKNNLSPDKNALGH